MLHFWAGPAGFTLAEADGISTWTSEAESYAVHPPTADEPRWIVRKTKGKRVTQAGAFPNEGAAKGYLYLRFGGGQLARDLRRMVREWEKTKASPITKTTDGYDVQYAGQTVTIKSVAEAREFAAYSQVHQDSGISPDRYVISGHLPNPIRPYDGPTVRVADVEAWFGDDTYGRSIDAPRRQKTVESAHDNIMNLLGHRGLSLEVMALLIQKGADVNYLGGGGVTPLEAHVGSPAALALLLFHGAVVTDRAVIAAVRTFEAESLNTLLQAGGNVNSIDPQGLSLSDIVAIRTEKHSMVEAERVAAVLSAAGAPPVSERARRIAASAAGPR